MRGLNLWDEIGLRISHRIYASLLLAGAISIMVAAVGCGGGQSKASVSTAVTSEPGVASTSTVYTTPAPDATNNKKWVIGLCVAAQSWVDDIDQLSSKVDPAQKDMSSLKDVMVEFLGTVDKRTKTLKSDVDSLGNPDIPDGAKLQAGLSSALGNVVTLFDNALSDAKALNAKDSASLQKGFQLLSDTLGNANGEIGDAFSNLASNYDVTALTQISENVPECSSLL
jgi:hypothetical protein